MNYSTDPIQIYYSDSETLNDNYRTKSGKIMTAIRTNPHQTLIGDTQPSVRLKKETPRIIVERQIVPVDTISRATNQIAYIQPRQQVPRLAIQPVAIRQPVKQQPRYVITQPIGDRKQVLLQRNATLLPYQPPEGFKVVSKKEKPKEKEPEQYSIESPEPESIASDETEDYNKQSKKLLSGFHPYYDRETDILALQCCTCCIGCWRTCSQRCTGCENFISCPIYCWICIILPLFLLLLAGVIVSALFAGQVITG